MRIRFVFLFLGFLTLTPKVFAMEEANIWRLQLAIATCSQPSHNPGSHLKISLGYEQLTQILNNPTDLENSKAYQVYELIPSLLLTDSDNVNLKSIKKLTLTALKGGHICIDHILLLANNPHDLWRTPEGAFNDLSIPYRILDIRPSESPPSNQIKYQSILPKHTRKIEFTNLSKLWTDNTSVNLKALPIIIPENYWEGIVRSSFGHQIALWQMAEGATQPSIAWSRQRDTVRTIYTNHGARIKIQLDLLSNIEPPQETERQKVSFDLVVMCSGSDLFIKTENLQTGLSPLFHILTFGYTKLLERSLHHAAGSSISRRNIAFMTSCVAPNFRQTARLLSLL